MRPEFDNVLVRVRGDQCVLCTVSEPFRLAWWPNVSALCAELGPQALVAEGLRDGQAQARFLRALSVKVCEAGFFAPALIGFGSPPAMTRRWQNRREDHSALTLFGECSREVLLGALALATTRVRRGGSISLQFKGWDAVEKWKLAQEGISDASSYLFHARGVRANVTISSALVGLRDDLWGFLYDRPWVRIAWPARELAGFGNRREFDQYRRSMAFGNLETLAQRGALLVVRLPVTKVNVSILPYLAETLTEATRGGSIEVAPVPGLMHRARGPQEPGTTGPEDDGTKRPPDHLSVGLLDGWTTWSWGYGTTRPLKPVTVPAQNELSTTPPAAEDYVAALSTIYGNPLIPLRQISPLSWVAARIESDLSLVSTPEAAGSALAALPSGDLYPGGPFVGLGEWYLGNVLDEPDTIRWERLDAVPEAFGNHSKPVACQTCDWRYRCGGVDVSEMLKAETGIDSERLFELYCAPRKALFEEMLWDSVAAAADGQAKRSRELIELHPAGIEYKPASTGEELDCQ